MFITVVVPVYNEEKCIRVFHERLSAALNGLKTNAEIIYVNDGSEDSTLIEIKSMKESDERITLLDLSRNFGKEIAVTAGLDYSSGDAVVVIDADLQDPPEVIPELVRYWKEGYDVVYGRRVSRSGETLFKRLTSYYFYRLIHMVNKVKIPKDVGDFRLLNRRAVDSIKQLREQHRFMKGLFSWIGFSQVEVPYHREPRHSGQTKWSYFRLWNFALEGVTSFTIAPLKFSTYLGLLVALGSFIYAVYIIYKTMVYGDPVAGYPSLMVIILFLGGLQLMTLGMIGEYLGRMFDETKGRPLYFVKKYMPAKSIPGNCKRIPGSTHEFIDAESIRASSNQGGVG